MTPEENFIQEYFQFDLETGPGSYEKLISDSKSLNWSRIKKHILSMRYFYFLKSSFWRIISEEVKRRAGRKCSCGSRESLQVHHGDEGNKNHGEEHLILDKLQCLCGKCHDALHGNSVKDAEKKRQRDDRKERILTQLPFYPGRMTEEEISGSSFTLTRKLLEELEHERKVIIERDVYEGWKAHRL